MSLATSAAPAASQPVAASVEQLIDHRIQEARRALWWAELSRGGLRMLIVWLIAVLAWVIIDQWVYSPGVAVRFAVAIGLLSWSVLWLTRRVVPLLGHSIRKEYAARSLERDIPEMRQELTSYVTLQDDRDAAGLRSRVVRSIGAQAAGRLLVHDALPGEATGTLKWWIAAAVALSLLAAYCVISPKNTFRSAGRLLAPLASIEPARRVSIEDVQPGDAEAIAGRQVEVSASILGLNEQDEIWCRWQTDAGAREAELALDKDTARYRGQIQLEHLAAGDVAYQIEAGDATAGPFHLRVQDVPVVAVESVRYQPPSYTGEVPHTSSSASITGVDGTQVTILASTNRAVIKAKIEFNPRPLGDSIRATAGAADMQIAEDGTTLSVSFPLRSARGRSAAVQLESYRVIVWDAADQSNPDPIIYPIRVIADLPPEVSIVMPRKSPKDVPIDAQQVIEVHAMDADFGLRRVGLEIRRGIDMVAEPTLWTDPRGAKGNRVSEYRFRAAEHGLRVGDIVQITATATDNRLVENDLSIEPNVSVTDPIKLRITASQPVANEPTGGDGLSPPDQRPPSDAGEDGNQESGQGSPSGGQGASGEGATGESGTSGAGTSGKGKTGESGESQQSGTRGKGSAGEKPTGSGTGESAAGETSPAGQPKGTENGEPSETKNGKPSGATPADRSDPKTDGSTGDDSPDGDSAEPGATESSDTTSAEKHAQPADGDADPSGQPKPDGSAGTDMTADGSGKQSTGEPKSGETESGDTESANSEPQSPTQRGSESTRDQSGDPSESQQTPKHDGEAFERIREYLDDMKRKGGSSGEESPEDGSKQSGEPAADGGDAPQRQHAPDGGSRSGSGDDAAQSGEGSAGQTGAEDKPNGESGKGSDADSTGDATGDSQSGESGERPSDTGESKPGDSKPGQPGPDDSKPGESKPGESKPGESKPDDSKPGESKPGESGSEAAESTGGQSPPGDSSTPGASRQPSSDGSQAQRQTPDPSQSPSQGGSGSGAGTDVGGKEGDAATPPDPPDLEYAKKATDMVLDYLEQTRDAPDGELLDRLNWTEEDLRRFAERWQQVRDLDQTETPDPQGNRDVEEALRSLGLRPPTQATANNRGTADSLRGVRDAGNRKPPPPAYQDAFDAFRRAMGRQQ